MIATLEVVTTLKVVMIIGTMKNNCALLLLAAIVLQTGCASMNGSSKPPRQQREGGNATTRLMIAEIALQRGDYPTAAREYSNAAWMSTDVTLAEQATRVAFEHRQDAIAVQSARHWLQLSDGAEEARRFLGLIALRLFSLEESARQYHALLQHSYATPEEGLIDLTGVLAEEESAYAVLSVMQMLADHYPKLPQAHYAVGVAAMRALNHELALSAARRSLELDPGFIEAERLLGRALLVRGHTEEALNVARRRAAASQEDAQARLEVGLLLAAAGSVQAARAELMPLLDIEETRAEVLRTLANIELGEGKLQDAARHFNELLTTGRYVSLAFYSLGAIHERQQETARAIRYYSRVTGGPYASDAHLRAARLLVASGAREQANHLLDTFAAENPSRQVDIAIGRARLLTDEGANEAALEVLDSARRKYPDSQELLYARSVALEHAGRVAETIAELRQALERRPEDPVALNALGYTLAEHRRNLPEAESLVRQALAKTPDSPAVQDSHGWVLHRLGQDVEALEWLKRAYEMQQDAEIAAHIGEVYWTLGERGKAREIWQAALATAPDHRYLLRTLRRYPD